MAQVAKPRPQSPPGSGSRFAKPEPAPKSEDKQLDEELMDSFPASDPPALTNPSRKVKTPAPAADPVKKAAKTPSEAPGGDKPDADKPT